MNEGLSRESLQEPFKELRDFLTTNGVAAARVEAIVEKLTRLGLRGVAGLEFSVEDRESGDAVQDELMRFGFEPIEAKLLANTVSRLRRARAAALQPPSAGGAAAPSGGQAAPVMIQPQVSALPLVAAAAPNAEFMAQLWLQALAAATAAVSPAPAVAPTPAAAPALTSRLRRARLFSDSDAAAVLKGLRSMAQTFKDDYKSGDFVPLPRLCVSSPQHSEARKGVVFRDCFQKIVDKIELNVSAEGNHFRDSRQIFVHGPEGIGKSHALRYAAARLWAKRLKSEADAKFRILYISKWHDINDENIIQELMLCFYDDPEMLTAISTMDNSAKTVQALLAGYTQQRLVIFLDQVFDRTLGTKDGRPKSMFAYFPSVCLLVFASSPTSETQALLLTGSNDRTIPVSFVDTLTFYESIVIVKQLSEEMEAPSNAVEAQRFPAVKKTVQNQLMALPNSPEDLEQLLQSITNTLRQSQEGKEVAQFNESQRVLATLLFLHDASGSVPLHLRRIFLEHLPKTGCIIAASESFSAQYANRVREDTFMHYDTLRGVPDVDTAQQQAGDMLSFVQSAIRHGKAEAGKVREEWQARGLSRVKLHDDLTVEPLCPAALHGLVRFMLEVALTTALEQRATLLESLREALKVQEFAVKARSFLREGIFLHKLAGKLNMPIQVTRSSEANANPERADLPTDHPNELTFEFNIMQFVDNFAQPPPGISEFSSAGARVLLLPRDFCEQHVRALCVNYAEKVMIAFQIAEGPVMRHQDSLDFFSAESDDRWREMISSGPNGWTKIMVWVLTCKDKPGQPWPDDAEVYQYQIDYDLFVDDDAEPEQAQQPRHASPQPSRKVSRKLPTQAPKPLQKRAKRI